MVADATAAALRKAADLKNRLQISDNLLNDEEALLAQKQLQKLYEHILLTDLEYALNEKVECDLWNFGFKNYIDALQNVIRKYKEAQKNEYQVLLFAFLDSANGFYIGLVQRICTTFSLHVPLFRKGLFYVSSSHKDINLRMKDVVKIPDVNSCYYVCQYSLLHLGDIARYRCRYKQAELFYRNAVVLSPLNGQPYNQLAVLESTRGNQLACVFYYCRSIALKNPFTAAFSNLSLTLSRLNDKPPININNNEMKICPVEFINIFLKVHAMMYLENCNMGVCRTLIQHLSNTLTAHVATESFPTLQLIQMIVINMFAYHKITAITLSSKERQQVLHEQQFHLEKLIIDLMAAFLNALLLPVYTKFKDDENENENVLQYYALPAVGIILVWIETNSHVLLQKGFTSRMQIWPALCKLLNAFPPNIHSFSHHQFPNANLPEDDELQAFVPLHLIHTDIKYKNDDIKLDLDTINKLRAYRLTMSALHLANDIQPPVIKTKENEDKRIVFEACFHTVFQPPRQLISSLQQLSLVSDSVESVSRASINTQSDKPTGILKTCHKDHQPTKILTNNTKRCNVALQSLLKKQEAEQKQVKFKTPPSSPSVSDGILSSNNNDIPPATIENTRIVSTSSTNWKLHQQPTMYNGGQLTQHNNFMTPPPVNVNSNAFVGQYNNATSNNGMPRLMVPQVWQPQRINEFANNQVISMRQEQSNMTYVPRPIGNMWSHGQMATPVISQQRTFHKNSIVNANVPPPNSNANVSQCYSLFNHPTIWNPPLPITPNVQQLGWTCAPISPLQRLLQQQNQLRTDNNSDKSSNSGNSNVAMYQNLNK